jgi:hypothetical protein
MRRISPLESGMKTTGTTLALLAAAAAAVFWSGAFAADSNERTSMPESCTDRSANCVIQDGPPRNRRGQLVEGGNTSQQQQQSGSNSSSSRDSKRDSSSDRNSSR